MGQVGLAGTVVALAYCPALHVAYWLPGDYMSLGYTTAQSLLALEALLIEEADHWFILLCIQVTPYTPRQPPRPCLRPRAGEQPSLP
jgi:hypothetical protein